jgi:pilus assembly protein Flp/PilA
MLQLRDLARSVRTWLDLTDDDGEAGQGLVEYGLIIVLISIVCIVALTAVGTALNDVFTQIAGNL